MKTLTHTEMVDRGLDLDMSSGAMENMCEMWFLESGVHPEFFLWGGGGG
jgi:hypothetical protein